MPTSLPPDLSAGRFRSLTGLSDKALRLYAERGVLVPSAVDPANGYRSYGADQLVDGVTLDLLRRARIPLDDLRPGSRSRFDEHRGRLAVRRAVEDFHLDLAERVATGDPAALRAEVTDADAAHWIGCEVPLGVSASPEDLEETFTAMAVDLPHVDHVLVEAVRAEGIELVAESWTSSASAVGAGPRMRLAHRVRASVPAATLRRVTEAVTPLVDASVRVASGTLPARRELVHSLPEPTSTSTEDPGLDDTALSYLASIAFAQLVAAGAAEALSDDARRRALSTSLFDPSASAVDVYDLVADGPPDAVVGRTGLRRSGR